MVLELSIDTASDVASIALSREGVLEAEHTWRCTRDHSRQLLPAIDALIARQGVSKADLTAICVCIGPGSYGGLRAGMSVAKGLAYALGLPSKGIGRLEVDAYPLAASGETIVAIHRAGRREIAWAAYIADPDWRELSPPALVPAAELAGVLPDGAIVTGDADDDFAAELATRGYRVVRGAATVRRAAVIAELGWRRMQAQGADDPKTLVPLYLREPAIGPQ